MKFILTDIQFMSIYTIFYYQLENILKPFLYDKYEIFTKDPPFLFCESVQTINIFIFAAFSIYTIQYFSFYKAKNATLYSMALIYIKYTMDNIIYFNKVNIYQYEFQRILMWCFTTPLILKSYCEMNNLSLMDINAPYHIINNTAIVFLHGFRRTRYYSGIILLLSTIESFFIYRLFAFGNKKYTKFIINIWILFSVISLIDVFRIISIQNIQISYLMSDIIAKLTTVLVINDHDEQMNNISMNVDLQSITLLSLIKKSIKQFEISSVITPKCSEMIKHFEYKISSYIPMDRTELKLELLRKILPLELEDKYLSRSKNYKEYNFICVMFVDIVSYTELARRFDSSVMYSLLNTIYTQFDDATVKYSNLQKIETIGDAYMVVGDIYNRDSKNNVKNMILLAMDLFEIIDKIKTPDGNHLQLRVGINLGKVVVGVLGTEIPRLCVIGNTVNVAARLQTSATPDKIHISKHVYEIASPLDLEILYNLREKTHLKNIGDVDTYEFSPHKYRERSSPSPTPPIIDSSSTHIQTHNMMSPKKIYDGSENNINAYFQFMQQ